MEPEQIIKNFCSLSEAMRAGAVLSPKCKDVYFRDGATCAIGAAILAIGQTQLLINGFPMEFLLEQFPYIDDVSNECPVGECFVPCSDAFAVVTHLNDVHDWPREAIADWLESEEEKLGFVTVIEGESSRSQTEVSGMVMV